MENIDHPQSSAQIDRVHDVDMRDPAEGSFSEADNRPFTSEKQDEFASAGSGRSFANHNGNTHNNIFGDPPISPRRAGKVYHMSSDIFGVGSIVNRSGQHMASQSDHKVFQDSDPSGAAKLGGDGSKTVGGRVERKGSNTKLPDDWKPNARENGCNPVTGDGYAEGDAGKSQKRHYQRNRSQSLW